MKYEKKFLPIFIFHLQSLSSNSSRGSENKIETESAPRLSFFKGSNETFVAATVENSSTKPLTGIPKASGLRQPQIKRSGLPRPMTSTKR